MKFLNYLLLLVLFLPAFVIAQTVTVSEEISIRNDNSYDIIGKMNDRFLLYREQANKIEIQAFDSRMRQSWDKELKFENKRFEVVGMVPDRDKFSVVYRYRKKRDEFLRVQQYDGGANMIDSATIITYEHTFGDPPHRLIYSEDRKKILIYSIKNQKDVKIISYDLVTRKIIWEADFELDDNSFFKEHLEILVTNQGVMYLIMGKDNRKSKMAEHRYLIYRCGQGSNAIELFQLPMDNKLTYSILFDYDNRNQVLVAGGLYSEKNLNRCDGHFSIRLPANNLANYQPTYLPFELQLISDLEGKIVTDFKGMENVRIQDVVLRKDGGMLLMFERTKEYERRMASSGRGMVGSDGLRYIVDYYYDNVFIIAVHPNGQKHWEQILHKKQYSQDDNAIFSSFFILKTPSALRLLFNDDIKQESTVSEYVINSVGEYDRNSVMSTENQEIKLRFRDAVQVASNEIIIPSERRNRLKLVRVIF